MNSFTIRDTTVDLPVFDEDVELTPITSLDKREVTSDFLFDGASLRSLDMEHVRLLAGRVKELRTAHAAFTDAAPTRSSSADATSPRSVGRRASSRA
jgi:hypothetical protein